MSRFPSSRALFDFSISKVWRRQRDRAQRDAVLYPLVTSEDGRSESLKRIAPLVTRLVRNRRSNLAALRAAGWKLPLNCTDGKLTYALNCPPFSVSTPNNARMCRWYRWCPFCWAREVVGETYERLEWTFFRSLGLERANKEAMVRLNLVEGRDVRDYRSTTALAELLAKEASQLGEFRHRLPNDGSYALTTIEPGGGYCTVERRFLAVVRPRSVLPKIPVDGTKRYYELKRYTRIDRGVLAQAVASTCSYPTQLMEGEPSRVAEILNGMQRFRFSVNYGCLRNSTYERLMRPL